MKSNVFIFILVIGLVFAGMSISVSDMDNRIVASVMETYVFKVYLQDEHINIVSTDGVVTLTGTIADELKKALAQETVAGLPDVKGVDNRLEVKNKTEFDLAAQLTSDIKGVNAVNNRMVIE